MQFTKHTLKNGTRLITAHNPNTRTFTVLVLFKVGSRYENKNINGISHYIEHLMFKGTTKRPNTLSISKELDAFGAEYNAFTGKDYTGYYVKINSEKKEQAMDVLSDMIHNSKFDAKEINRERNVIIEEIHMYRDNPLMHIEDLIEEEMFRGDPLGWSIAGDEASMAKITRENIVDFFGKHYVPKNTVIILSGNLEDGETVNPVREQLQQKYLDGNNKPIHKSSSLQPPTESAIFSNGVKLAEKYFNQNKAKDVATHFKKFGGTFKPVVKVEYKDTGQYQLAIAFPGLRYRDPDMPACNLLANILGGTMSSRLFIKVRERKGLAYLVRAELSPYQDTGAFVIRAGLNKGNLKLAIKTILAELKDIKTKGVGEKELSRAKENIKGHMILGMEDSSDVANWYGKQEILTNEIWTLDEHIAKMERVKSEDIKRLANKIFDLKKVSVACIGPLKDADEIKKLLK